MSAPSPATGTSDGFREAISCDVCLEVYEQASRTPLVLPCGHTFCRTCLVAIRSSGHFLCPKCKADHNRMQVEALTINYSLLNILPYYSDDDLRCDKCATHGDDLRYWCSTCALALCSICLYSGHPQGHTVKLTQTYVEEKKLLLMKKIKVIFKDIECQKKEFKEGFNDLDAQVKKLFRRNAYLQNTEVALNGLLADIQKANNITSVMYLEKAVGEFQSEKGNLTDLDDEEIELEARLFGDTPVTGKNLPSGEEEVPHPCQEQQSSVPLPTPPPHPSCYRSRDPRFLRRGGFTRVYRLRSKQIRIPKQSQELTEVQRAMMDYCDGRLLLHTLAEPTASRLSLQVPCEVFLELGVGDRRLGHVYISLWCHLRQAQQFLALCMGTMGPSLLGTKASEKVRNTIVFKSAIDRNKQSVAQPLLMGLEWGRQHSKTESEGLVTGMAGNNGIAFGICIQGQTNAIMNAPFGKVVAGLEAANNAFQHNPVTEVTITQCGIVLPGLSQYNTDTGAHAVPFTYPATSHRLSSRDQVNSRGGYKKASIRSVGTHNTQNNSCENQ